MKNIIYCRKSSEDDNRQILSIGSQESEMSKVADRFTLKIDKIYHESMTAKAPGRPVFGEMMAFVEKHKDCTILVWKLDRLARNPVDEGKIKWLLQQGIIKQIKTPDRDYNPEDNVLIASVEFGMANQYIRDLRQNVMRGNRTKLERGGWPNMAPFGYSNNKADRSIVVNPTTASAVQKIFELYASGKYSLKEVKKLIYEQGFRTKKEKQISMGNIHRILKNPFYYGVMIKDGIHYQGKHEPLISKNLFDKVDEVLHGKNHGKQQKHEFPLRGLMTCNVCGCLLTATLQKGKYIYYYCTNGKGICTQRKKHLKEHDANVLVSDVLQVLKTDERLLDIACKANETKYKNEVNREETTRQSLVKRLNTVKEQQDMLTRRKDTPEDVYSRNMTSLRNEQVDLEVQLSKLSSNPDKEEITFEQVKKVFLEANNIADSFFDADPSLKHDYAKTILSNISIKDNKAQHFQFKKPYQRIAMIPKCPSLEQLCAE